MKYNVQMMLGSTKFLQKFYASSVQNVKSFLDDVSMAKIREIRQTVFEDKSSPVPDDDLNYQTQIRVKAYNENDAVTSFVLNKVKKTLSDVELQMLIRENLSVRGLPVVRVRLEYR